VRFRERINVNLVNQINQRMVKKSQEESEEEAKKKAHYQKGRNKRSAQSREINTGCYLCARRYQLSQ
jgi:IS5 family transposase